MIICLYGTFRECVRTLRGTTFVQLVSKILLANNLDEPFPVDLLWNLDMAHGPSLAVDSSHILRAFASYIERLVCFPISHLVLSLRTQ